MDRIRWEEEVGQRQEKSGRILQLLRIFIAVLYLSNYSYPASTFDL
jgi:hypothetical protein